MPQVERLPGVEPHGQERPVGEVIITGKNQITLPVAATRAAHWERGDRLVVLLLQGDMVLLMRKPSDWAQTFAGALSHVFGSSDDTRAYLEQERSAWEQPEE
jgi:hypothetical protein